ncbi:tyrosine-type recombinase/integrase [Paracoccus sp. 22332]|uniref:tyrosine-type recombinase/integrase n=1 Tax=Paracoccus sp. 22332 TaxID=3453913 RepID=UPI003F8558FB
MGATPRDRHAINILRNYQGTYQAPQATLADAVKLYLREKLGEGGDSPDDKTIVRVRRDVGRISEALGIADPVLSSLTREDARTVRDYLLVRIKRTGEKVSAASARRELNTIRAVVSYAVAERLLPASFDNPFNSLSTTGQRGAGPSTGESENRGPLPPAILQEVRKRVVGGAGEELGLIWRLLEGTGARVSEVAGLRREDIVLSGPVGQVLPHMRVAWHENRRLKTQTSIRHVPLVGDALEAAKEALGRPGVGPMLFPSYGRKGGGDAVSAALMKHVRRVTTNRRHVVHSLRHNMKDRLILAEVSTLDQNLILGYALGGVGDRVYGGALPSCARPPRE